MNLSAENLGVKIGNKEILCDVNYTFAEKKITAIIGPNGAGKSTLLKALCLLNENFSGRVTLNGADIRKTGRRELAKIMAILPQEKDTPSDTTVRQLVSFGRFPQEDSNAISRALEVTNLTDFENRQVNSLSGGERQRAWLAMTLAQRPKILLLDEPTTYLDIAHQLDVMEIVKTVNKNFGTTIIMVLHDINHVRIYADEVAVVKNHRIFSAGEPKKILTAEKVGEIFEVHAETFANNSGEIIFPISRK